MKTYSKKTKKTFEEITFERKGWSENSEQIRLIAQVISDNDCKIDEEDKEQKDLYIKIKNHIEKSGIGTFKEFINLILQSDIFASYLAKNPTKQQRYQKRFFRVLEEIVRDRDDIDLVTANSRRSSGERLFLNNDGEISLTRRGDERDIDVICAKIKNGGRDKVMYISHKRIGGEGSSQGDQYREVRLFLKYASKNNNKNESFVLAYEGDYFNNNRLKELGEICNWRHVHIVEATDIEGVKELVS